MEQFFNDFFLEAGAIYTLLGSKPMSGTTIDTGSEEDWAHSADSHIANKTNQEKEKIQESLRKEYRGYKLYETWNKWVLWKRDHPSTKFLFRVTHVLDNPRLINIDMINTAEVAWTFEKYYSIFKTVLQRDFDPLKVSLEFEDQESHFWKEVLQNHFLSGLLYGYGERNAYFFAKEFGEKISFPFPISKASTNTQSKLSIPLFRSYSIPLEIDPVVVKYNHERKKIQKLLKNKALTSLILENLYEDHLVKSG